MDQSQLPVAIEADDVGNEPPFRGNQYVCPNCRQVIPTRKIVLMAKPPRFAHLLNDIIRCCFCNFLFSYRGVAIRAIHDDKGHAAGTVVSA